MKTRNMFLVFSMAALLSTVSAWADDAPGAEPSPTVNQSSSETPAVSGKVAEDKKAVKANRKKVRKDKKQLRQDKQTSGAASPQANQDRQQLKQDRTQLKAAKQQLKQDSGETPSSPTTESGK